MGITSLQRQTKFWMRNSCALTCNDVLPSSKRLAVTYTFFVKPCVCINGNVGIISKSDTFAFCTVMFYSLLRIHTSFD